MKKLTAAAPFFILPATMSKTFISEYNSNHNVYQLYKLDGVTPLVGGQVIVPKQGMRVRGKAGLSYLHTEELSFFDQSKPQFIPHEKPGYDVNDPNAGWVSYNSTRRGGFRPYNLRRAREQS